jgi:purine operon repressor
MVRTVGKTKRSERIGMILLMLSKHPNTLFTLSQFAEMFSCAKSTLSEDMTAVRSVIEENGLGRIETVAGAAGGVRYLPFSTAASNLEFVQNLCDQLSDSARIMPGGFLYTVDFFSDPRIVRRLGEIFAQTFYKAEPDIVVTVESRGIPIGLMTAQALGKPLVVARKENRATEGSLVTLNYISTSSKRLQTMSLPRRAVKEGQKALVIDDFVKGGGTVGAICDIMKEFAVTVVGAGTLIGAPSSEQKRVRDIKSLLVLENVDEETGEVFIRPSSWLRQAAEQK